MRLLPTTRPYMLQKLWPDMIPGELQEFGMTHGIKRYLASIADSVLQPDLSIAA